ncbi:MAG: FAD-dependent oxidoreductase [Anaerolineae bacterium]
MAVYREPARDVPVVASYDVIVAGGGVSGVAAAMGAARAGARTLIVERSGCFGGVATAGLMASISNRYFTADGTPVLGGPAREMVEQLVAMGAATPQWMTPELPGITLDTEAFKVVLLRLLRGAGVDMLLLAQISGVMLDGPALTGVIVDTIGGRQAIAAKVVVDATEGAVVSHMAGAPTFVEKSNGSLLFRMSGVDVDAFIDYYAANPGDYPSQRDRAIPAEWFVRNWRERGVLFFPHGGGRSTDLIQRHVKAGAYKDRSGRAYDLDAFGLYAVRANGLVAVNSNFFATDLDAWEATHRENEAREMAFYAADFLRQHVPGFASGVIATMAEYVGVRTSRWIDGARTLELPDQTQPVRQADVIGVTPCQGRSEGGGGMVLLSDWYDIPYGCLLPKNVPGLIVGSGKTVAAKPRGVMRGISRCLPIGHAAGVAAAIAARDGISPEAVDVKALQHELLRQDAFLGDGPRLSALGL